MDTLPEELLLEIIILCGKHSPRVSQVCKQYHKLYLQFLNNIIRGLVTPDVWLTSCVYDAANFEEPINDFLALENEQYHDRHAWDVNGINIITDADKLAMKKTMHGAFEAVYCAQCPSKASDYWLLIAKTSDNYVCFMSSCSYSIYWGEQIERIVTGGTFAYHKDWKTLWNMYLTRNNRDDLLALTKFVHDDWHITFQSIINDKSQSNRQHNIVVVKDL